MKLSHVLPVHRLCTRRDVLGGYPHPVFTGKLVVASNGVGAVFLPVEDAEADLPGFIPRTIMRAAVEQPGDDHVIEIKGSGVVFKAYEGNVESHRVQVPALANPDLSGAPKPPAKRKGAVRVALNAAQLHQLAGAMGSNGKDQAVLLELSPGEDGIVRDPIRVLPYGDDARDGVIGALAPWSKPSAGEEAHS